jgi:hypothetical protein
MDGLQVLWHLLTTEPFFWFILSIGFVAIGVSIWIDRWEDQENIVHYDDSHHSNR